MAQPLRCDVHDDTAGTLLIQNLGDGTVLVGCSECAPNMTRALADQLGVTDQIADEVVMRLNEEVEKAAAKRERAETRKAGRKTPQPQDTGAAGESTAPAG